MTGIDSRHNQRWALDRIVMTTLGIVLVLAACAKAHQLISEPFVAEGPFLTWKVTAVIVQLEFMLGLWLIGGFFPRAAQTAAVCVFAALFSVSLENAIRGNTSCGCFGAVSINPWHTANFNLGTVIALICLDQRASAAAALSRPRFVARMSTAMALAGGFAVGLSTIRPATISRDGQIVGESENVRIDSSEWIGARFPLLQVLDAADELAYGRWTIYLIQPDCPLCRELITAVGERWDERVSGFAAVARLGIIEVTSDLAFTEELRSRFPSLALWTLPSMRSWLAATPAEIVLDDGVVMSSRVLTRDSIKHLE